jgi:hypothetical protein
VPPETVAVNVIVCPASNFPDDGEIVGVVRAGFTVIVFEDEHTTFAVEAESTELKL